MKTNRVIGVLFTLALAGVVTGCRQQTAAAAATTPPVQVIVVEARRQPVAETLSLPATVVPNETVEIKPETDGIVQETKFGEGERVGKGQTLVQLDETKFATAVAEALNSVKHPGQQVQAVYLGQTDRFGSRTPESNQLCEIWQIHGK